MVGRRNFLFSSPRRSNVRLSCLQCVSFTTGLGSTKANAGNVVSANAPTPNLPQYKVKFQLWAPPITNERGKLDTQSNVCKAGLWTSQKPKGEGGKSESQRGKEGIPAGETGQSLICVRQAIQCEQVSSQRVKKAFKVHGLKPNHLSLPTSSCLGCVRTER